jgi:hypothetical protein
VSPADLALTLRINHVRTLFRIRTLCLFGWENFDLTEMELEVLGLIRGEWTGSIEHPARPMWAVTELGRKVLELLSVQNTVEQYTGELVEPRMITKA